MAKFGERSLKVLKTCDPRLQTVLNRAIKLMDITILEGHRDNDRQNQLLDMGLTKLKGGLSKHNLEPSKAVDAAPYPINWEDKERFAYMAGLIKGIGSEMGVKIRWGGDWDSDGELSDNRFNDLPHFEITGGV